METMGWVLVLLAALIVRGAAKGRGLADNYHDIGDLFIAVLSMDTNAAKSVLARTGTDSTGAPSSDPNAAPSTPSKAPVSDGGHSLKGGTQK